MVTFLGGFEGCLDLLHLAEHGGNGEVKKTYPVKTKVRTVASFGEHHTVSLPLKITGSFTI